jgi:hypothetical protein
VVSGLSAAAVVAGAITVVALRGSDPSPTGAPPGRGTSGDVSSTAPEPPAGYRFASYRGQLIVAVPESLPVRTNQCVLPRQYVLAEDPNVSYDCVTGGVERAQQTLTVRLTSAASASDQIPTTPADVSGLNARIGYGTLGGYPGVAGQAVFADEDFAVIVTAPTHAQVETILTSVRPGGDPLGCPAELTDVDNPASGALVPADPSTAVRCVYLTGRDQQALQASMPVHGLSGLVAAIDGLPTDPPSGSDGQPAFETDLLRFDYPDGSSRTLLVRMSDPTAYSDGQRTGYDDNNVVTDQLRSATS